MDHMNRSVTQWKTRVRIVQLLSVRREPRARRGEVDRSGRRQVIWQRARIGQRGHRALRCISERYDGRDCVRCGAAVRW